MYIETSRTVTNDIFKTSKLGSVVEYFPNKKIFKEDNLNIFSKFNTIQFD
jgi:hypothetical protein